MHQKLLIKILPISISFPFIHYCTSCFALFFIHRFLYLYIYKYRHLYSVYILSRTETPQFSNTNLWIRGLRYSLPLAAKRDTYTCQSELVVPTSKSVFFSLFYPALPPRFFLFLFFIRFTFTFISSTSSSSLFLNFVFTSYTSSITR